MNVTDLKSRYICTYLVQTHNMKCKTLEVAIAKKKLFLGPQDTSEFTNFLDAVQVYTCHLHDNNPTCNYFQLGELPETDASLILHR